MGYKNSQIAEVALSLKVRFDGLNPNEKRSILNSNELKALFEQIKNLPVQERSEFGKEINQLKAEVISWINDYEAKILPQKPPIDITAPFDTNIDLEKRPQLFSAKKGSIHPVMNELDSILDIFARMGFNSLESRELDDDFHMFGSLNFPDGHPARDDYDTFVTEEGLIAPAHTSTMQNRILTASKSKLENGSSVRWVMPGRVFRNEDLDARHEHTFYQLEGICVGQGINTGHLVSTIKTWLSTYYKKDMEVKIQPFYFPFTEPSFEFAAGCIFCQGKGCQVCSHTGWIELGGCGMIHPNVLKSADIDSAKFSGFAWGFGIERLVMLKYGIEDVRHFHSANLKFLEQFK